MIVTAPEMNLSVQNANAFKVFMAGGITNCPDWQSDLLNKLPRWKDSKEVNFFNPRRASFDITDPNATEVQITWEHTWLKLANAHIFWFSTGSLNPIVLYELGRWGNSNNKPMFVGMDKDYARRKDVEIQTALDKSYIKLRYSLDDLAADIDSALNAMFQNI